MIKRTQTVLILATIIILTLLLSGCQQPDYSAYFTEVPGNTNDAGGDFLTATQIIAATEAPVTPTATATTEPTQAPPTETPTATPTEIPFGDKLYATDFSVGWPDLSTQKGTITVSSDGYRFDQDASWAQWTYTTVIKRGQFYASVEVNADNCPSGDGRFGLIFHYDSSSSFRYFAVTCEGGYILFERNLPSGTVLAEGNLPEDLAGDSEAYTLAVRVADNEIKVYVNDLELASYTVGEVTAGDLGIYVESTDSPMSITFTALNVYNIR